MNEWINQWMNESMNEWINEWINESMNKSISQSVNQSINQPPNQSTNQPTIQPINLSINPSASKWNEDNTISFSLQKINWHLFDWFHHYNIILCILYLLVNFMLVFVSGTRIHLLTCRVHYKKRHCNCISTAAVAETGTYRSGREPGGRWHQRCWTTS